MKLFLADRIYVAYGRAYATVLRPSPSVCLSVCLSFVCTECIVAKRCVLLEVGRCRYFASVSVFVFLVGFYKSLFGIRYRFLKISDIGSVFRLSNPLVRPIRIKT